jgi:hypothetical protein
MVGLTVSFLLFPPHPEPPVDQSSVRSNRQVPGYLESQDALKEAGIDEIIVYCVNDGAVMKVSTRRSAITRRTGRQIRFIFLGPFLVPTVS